MNKNQQLNNENIQIYYIHNGKVENGVFVKTPNHPPVATVALLMADKKIARGVAICSVNDNFSRQEGRKRAIGRARKALYTMTNLDRLDLKKSEWDEQADSVRELLYSIEEADGHYGKTSDFQYLSEYSPRLTDYEMHLIDINREKAEQRARKEREDMLVLEKSLDMAFVPF